MQAHSKKVQPELVIATPTESVVSAGRAVAANISARRLIIMQSLLKTYNSSLKVPSPIPKLLAAVKKQSISRLTPLIMASIKPKACPPYPEAA